jgi:hypothetical protein
VLRQPADASDLGPQMEALYAPAVSPKEAVVDWVDTLETVVVALILAAVAAVSIFRYGSRIGVWFSELMAENRRLFWAAIALVGWTFALAAGAWGASLLLYLNYAGIPLDRPANWATASSMALLLASPVVAILAGLPWLVLVGVVRLLRWRSRRAGVREQEE